MENEQENQEVARTNDIKLSDEVHNYKVKDDKKLTLDYYKLLDLQKTIDVLINGHFNEIKERSEKAPVNGYRVVKSYGNNRFDKDLAFEWLETNKLIARFSVTKAEYIIPEVIVPEETNVDMKAVQKELKNRYKDSYNSKFCNRKETGEKIERVEEIAK